MTPLEQFRQNLQRDTHLFTETLEFIDARYDYIPTAFDNGSVQNVAGQNEGSCKTLALAKLESFSDDEALRAFGEHFRDVVKTPDGTNHANIRALQVSGLAGVRFEAPALTRR